mgnify:CR=1 FL=1
MWGLCGTEIAAARVVSRCVRALVSRGLHLLDSGVADAVVARRLSILELLELPGFRECSLDLLGQLRRNVSWSAAEPYPPGEQEARPPWWQCDRF